MKPLEMKSRSKSHSGFSVMSSTKPSKSVKSLSRKLSEDSTLHNSSDSDLLISSRHSRSNNCVIGKLHSLSLNDKRYFEKKSDYSDNESDCSQLTLDDDSTSLMSFDNFSVISSNNSYPSSEESSDYHSSISRCIKRRKLESCDSVVDERQESIQPNSNSSNSKQKNRIKLFWFFLLLVLLIIIAFSFTNNFSICQIDNENLFNFRSIEANLSECLIGQDFARIALIEALAEFNFNHSNADKFKLVWLVGPVGVGKSYTRHLVMPSIGTSFKVFNILNIFLPQDLNRIKKEVEVLIQSFDICKANLIWIDSFDEHDLTIEFLNLFLKEFKLAKDTVFHNYSVKVLIIVTGTYMSEDITKFYIKHRASGQRRETLDYNKLKNDLADSSPFRNKTLPFNLAVIPFLPLEIDHIESCVIQQLNFLLKRNRRCVKKSSHFLEKEVQSHNLSLREIQDQVIELSRRTAVDDSTEIVHSGCKRIYRIVTSLWFNIPESEFTAAVERL